MLFGGLLNRAALLSLSVELVCIKDVCEACDLQDAWVVPSGSQDLGREARSARDGVEHLVLSQMSD